MGYLFKKADITDMVNVSGELIDTFLSATNGDFIKVYLFVLRHAKEKISEDSIADALDLTIRDVQRAITYWMEAGFLAEEVDADTSVEPDAVYEEDEGILKEKETLSRIDLHRLQNDETFSNLAFAIQTYLAKTFSAIEMETLAYLYDALELPADMLEYLVEVHVQKGKMSFRYIETVALDLHAKGIVTLAQAKEALSTSGAEVWDVMRAYGLNQRQPAPAEQTFIKKWFYEYGFSKELVLEAIERTMLALSKPSFEYTEGILTRWRDKGVRTLADVKDLDTQHKERASKPVFKTANTKNTNNRFNNFEQRNDDLDAKMLEAIKRKIGQ